MPLQILTGNEKCQRDYNKKFKETHPGYFKDKMREHRKKKIEQRIHKAYELLYGKEER